MTGGGREERFRRLYETTRPRVLAYALRRTTSTEDAADVVAETYTIAWRRLDDVPDGEASILWLYATGRRVLANHRRRLSRHAELIDRIGVELGSAFVLRSEASEADAVAARVALEHLSDDDRELLLLTAWEGLSSSELARVLGCSPTAARIRLHRARVRLLAELSSLGLITKQSPPSRHSPPRGQMPTRAPEEP